MYDVKNETTRILLNTARTYVLMSRETGLSMYADLARQTLRELNNYLKTWDDDATQEYKLVA